MAIQIGGIVSGLDTESIIEKMMTIEKQPIELATTRQEGFTVKLTAMGLMESKLKTLKTTLTDLDHARDFNVFSTSSSDESVFTATASVSASAGSFDISVTQLAKAQKLTTTAGFTKTEAVGAGTLHIKYSTTATPVDIVVDAGDTLSDIADAINSSDAKVTAKVISSDGTNEFLSLTADNTGVDNAITLTIDDADGNDAIGLSRLSMANMTVVQAAQNAVFSVDGVTGITRASNTITDVITGVSLTLKKAHTDPLTESDTVTLTRDTSEITENLTAFVDAYNDVLDFFSEYQKKYDAEEKTAGILVGDSTTNMIKNTLRRNLNSVVSGITSLDSLSDLGISLNQEDDPRLEINSDTLSNALKNNFEDVQKFFSQSTDGSEGFAVRLVDNLNNMLNSTDGTLTTKKEGITSSIDRLQTSIDAMEERNTSTEASLWTRFNAMELVLAQYKSTGDYMTAQITALQNLSSSIYG